MNGNALACRADQVDDYDVHMTYAIKMQDIKLALVVVADYAIVTRAFYYVSTQYRQYNKKMYNVIVAIKLHNAVIL